MSASTQNQALAALLFLYRQVLERELPWLDDLTRAKKARTLPVVLSRDEVHRVLAELSGVPLMMASLLYGGGLRLLECARLRVKDIDFDRPAEERTDFPALTERGLEFLATLQARLDDAQ